MRGRPEAKQPYVKVFIPGFGLIRVPGLTTSESRRLRRAVNEQRKKNETGTPKG
jgi:hypothetical protein